jgi:hypothetical protein
MFKWFGFFGIEDSIQAIRTYAYVLKSEIPSWVYFSLPDGLWAYSFSSAILIHYNNDRKQANFWLKVPFFLAVMLEIFQSFQWFPGTFDFLDLLFSIIGFFLSKIILIRLIKRSEKQVL